MAEGSGNTAFAFTRACKFIQIERQTARTGQALCAAEFPQKLAQQTYTLYLSLTRSYGNFKRIEPGPRTRVSLYGDRRLAHGRLRTSLVGNSFFCTRERRLTRNRLDCRVLGRKTVFSLVLIAEK